MHAALKETEKAHGLRYVESKLHRGSMLLQASYDAPDPSLCFIYEDRWHYHEANNVN